MRAGISVASALLARQPDMVITIARDVETDELRARQQRLARGCAPVAAAIPVVIIPACLLLAAHLAWRCLPTLIAQAL